MVSMCKKLIFSAFVSSALLWASCSSSHRIVGFERSRILIDSSYDKTVDKEIAAFMAPYKQHVDSIMSPVVGTAAEYLYAERPESNLSNLLSDILVWCGNDYGERPDFAVYNIGGMRSAFAKGDITYGDVLDVAPFENKICFVTLTGDKVMVLFGQIAASGGEGVSHGVELVITEDGQLKSALLHGRRIVADAKYRIATLDYLAQGNDKLEAFKASTDVKSPSSDENNVRFIIMKYMKEKRQKGESVGSQVEGRIKIEGR